jgi:pimeloyl-ACP methyl ester carboxylesterase
LTINQYVEDIRALSEWLIKKYNKEKVIVVGHFWGSVIGLLAVEKYTLLFEYYIGIGQVTVMVEDEKRGSLVSS